MTVSQDYILLYLKAGMLSLREVLSLSGEGKEAIFQKSVT